MRAALAGFGGIEVTLTPLNGREGGRPHQFTAKTNFTVWVRNADGTTEILTSGDVPGQWE
ncbi:MAG: hypothetical protein IMX01_08975 [Limnochordaceae bacterium]|nr:hypothetical protein [Limnochordaceae bacterium]